ncbi:hypothetical protein [Corynebacterium glyciniphilum]|uniref:hypothetical protein n=1 Tax=Corynebacterium glyciniphilum TaxID=1404244 RepID=UPI00265000F8|nr:hypothetical protein [Corynebacterium glyciniphilum]MDN6706392.1 hypothetical protein [Corynebacterium glyciniphilum]
MTFVVHHHRPSIEGPCGDSLTTGHVEADTFDIGSLGHLVLFKGTDLVAAYAPGSWTDIGKEVRS